MIYYVDRFEDDIAVLESNGTTVNIPRVQLPPDAKEGSALEKQDDGTYLLDEDTAVRRRKELFDLQNSLFSD